MCILVVAPHPDDEVLGCGGVIARHAEEGDDVHVVIMTRGIPEIFPPAEIQRTREEMRRAHALLGVKEVHEIDLPAPRLDTLPSHVIADQLRSVISAVKPHTVYLPHRGDIHIDHQLVYQATLVAARPIGSSVKRMLCYETLSETEWGPPLGDQAFVPTVFVEISPYLEKKTAALAMFVSQMQDAPHSRSVVAAEALARYRGSTVGVHAAEAFMMVREILDLQ